MNSTFNTTIFLLGATSSISLEFMKTFVRRPSTGSYKILSFVRPAEKQTQKLNRESFNYVTSLSTTSNCLFQTIDYDGSEEDLVDKFISACDDEDETNRCEVINLSTYSFVNVLKLAQARDIPTFIIGSGAVVDWANGRLKINDYVEGKLRAERESTTTIHPGFYIKDTPNDKDSVFPWHGLHLDTYHWMFSDYFDESKDWGKKYYVTQTSFMIDIICKWIDNPEKYGGHYSVGSYKPLYRYEIRELSGLSVPKEVKDKFPSLDPIYQSDMQKTENQFNMQFTQLTSAFQNAREWTSSHAKEFEDYVQLSSSKN